MYACIYIYIYMCVCVCVCNVYTLTEAISEVIPTHSTVGDLIRLQQLTLLLLLTFEYDVLCSMVVFIVVVN